MPCRDRTLKGTFCQSGCVVGTITDPGRQAQARRFNERQRPTCTEMGHAFARRLNSAAGRGVPKERHVWTMSSECQNLAESGSSDAFPMRGHESLFASVVIAAANDWILKVLLYRSRTLRWHPPARFLRSVPHLENTKPKPELSATTPTAHSLAKRTAMNVGAT